MRISIVETVAKYGAENIVFLANCRPLRRVMFISYTSSSDAEVMLPQKICQERYKVEDKYKITLKPTIEGYAKEDYYIMDLERMIECGTVQMLVRVQTATLVTAKQQLEDLKHLQSSLGK